VGNKEVNYRPDGRFEGKPERFSIKVMTKEIMPVKRKEKAINRREVSSRPVISWKGG